MKWPARRLEEICSLKTGKLDSNAAVTNGEFPFFTCAQETYRIDKAAFDTEAVLLGGNNAAGIYPLKYYKGEFNAYQRTYVIEALDEKELCIRFLYFSLTQSLTHFQNASIGAATQYLTKSILNNFEVILPPIAKQQAITNILSTYDDLIENNRRRMTLLEDAARQVYQEWFVRLRFPGREHTRIVDGVPEGWEKVCASEIIDVNPRERVESGKEIWYVPMACLSVVGMTVDVSGFEARTTHTAVKFRKDDVLLARITPCLENGKTAFVHFLEEGEVACGSTEFIILRGQKVSPYFTYCLARSYDFRENAIKSMVGSSGRQRVQTSCFEKFVLGLPPRTLLFQFDEATKGSFEQIANLTKQNQKLRTARDLLLPKLMSGEIAV